MSAPVIPTCHLPDLESSDDALRGAATAAILEGFGTYGLVYLSGHGIDRAEVERFYDRFSDVTDLPEATKQNLARPNEWYQRGWTPPNTEKAVIAGGQPDFKECYFMAPMTSDAASKIHYPQIHADNVWPDDKPEFRERYLALGRTLQSVGAQLLRGCAQALGLSPDTFDPMLEGGPHVTRALRYLQLSPSHQQAGVVWGEEHTDFNLVTLLPGGRFLSGEGEPCAAPDDGCGLYLRTRATDESPHGELIRGRAPKGCIVAQVGQQLEILTGGRLQATPHVITAPKTLGYSRQACAHFIHLRSDQVLLPLDDFKSEETLREYGPPVLAGTYSLKTLVDIGLAPEEALTALGYRQYDRLAKTRT